MEQIKQGHFKIVISTGQFFGEGIDISNLECLFIVYPFAFEGKLIQYIGRIQRSEKQPVIFDYRDSRIDHFEKMFKQRMRYYKKLRKTVADSKLPLVPPMTILKDDLLKNDQNLSESTNND